MTLPDPAPGPSIRADIVDVYVFRHCPGHNPPAQPTHVEFLQLRRATGMLAGSWQPLMGHIQPRESALQAALRELNEELGLAAHHHALSRFWALEQVHPYFLAPLDAIVLSPRFAAEVRPDWQPRLSPEHDAHRWVAADHIDQFMWPGQRAAVAEILNVLLAPGSAAEAALRIDPRST